VAAGSASSSSRRWFQRVKRGWPGSEGLAVAHGLFSCAVSHFRRPISGSARAATRRSGVRLEGTLDGMSESPSSFDAEIADHQVILRAGQVEAVVVPLEEYRALKTLEQREAELYWDAHQDRHPARPGDEVPDGKVYDSMEALMADLGAGE
jgi:hypothetical protein